ncbi:MAG: hypothetical protein Q8928_04385 [Bacteroidota bacterium]|nr:hypothetical protein [Bacteroidota bacterium]
MGHQINFFLNEDDQKDFDNLLRTFDDICFLSYFNKSNIPTIIDDTIIRDKLKEGSRVYLVRKQDLKNIKFRFIEKFNYWLIDDSPSPVLHFDRCVSYNSDLRSGRLYFEPKYVENLQWIEKSVDFIKWSDSVIAKARRFFKKYKFRYPSSSYGYTAYLGQNAMKLIEENKAEIELTGGRLIIK